MRYRLAAHAVAIAAAVAAVLLLVFTGHPSALWAFADGVLLGSSSTIAIKHTND
jgi:hypothetical protein